LSIRGSLFGLSPVTENLFRSRDAGSRRAANGLLWGRKSRSLVGWLFVSAGGSFDELRELRLRLLRVCGGFVSRGFAGFEFLLGDSPFSLFLLSFFVFGHIGIPGCRFVDV
jgi:hypothetical protein